MKLVHPFEHFTETSKVLSDEDRLAMCHKFAEVRKKSETIFNRTDLFSQEKTAEYMKVQEVSLLIQMVDYSN